MKADVASAAGAPPKCSRGDPSVKFLSWLVMNLIRSVPSGYSYITINN
jgi:hypothetical protein